MERPIKPVTDIVLTDAWVSLKAYTAARIALGRAGTAQPLKQILKFRLDHAHARDAVYSMLAIDDLKEKLDPFDLPVLLVNSQAKDREEYLQRPDLGRKLDAPSVSLLGTASPLPNDIVIILADGLSALAINSHAPALLQLLIPALLQAGLSLSPLIIAREARVAIGDEIGSLLKAKVSVVLIGERPGLSSPDSMGAYITYAPAPGTTDSRRNCISNIRPEGLSYPDSCDRLLFLVKAMISNGLSGIDLKDSSSGTLLLPS